ncbi:hypothetical protein K458DRAFT_154031 [Lentithecium fluviatile CBS 122367]|uniref:Uncharacterized protein n=1 Tax=Lentithecium fluviatile CBS 122367 TaxID=1168545 RepID=A0A6G1JE64_9PLEO|nr:hypothetical protein K458DRAFT_154031 [Lentithecium fluviatile CBS 122367]
MAQSTRKDEAGPPVPPKALPPLSTKLPTGLRSRRPQPPPKDQKLPPLPPTSKALSELPPGGALDYRATLLWVLGFCVWFVVIVVMLPVIMERDVMPGFNRWLRQSWRLMLG